MSSGRTAYRILPLEKDDVRSLASISQAAFAADAHTRMKMSEKGVTDLGSELEPAESILRQLDSPQMKMVKAVDSEGKMVGFSNWRMWNFDKDPAEVRHNQARMLTMQLSTFTPTPDLDAEVVNPDFPVLPTQTPLEQLQATTSGHMFGMISRVNRPDKRTFFCTGISVHPDYQSKGVASALLDWATRFADKHQAQSWVHLSDHPGGVKAFEKYGFEVVNSVTVDLDRYAKKERPEGRPWGKYTFRFLLRMPQPADKA